MSACAERVSSACVSFAGMFPELNGYLLQFSVSRVSLCRFCHDSACGGVGPYHHYPQ